MYFMDDMPQNPPTEPPAEAILREAALEALRAGRVPAHQASRIWGGSGSGRGCPVCQKPIEEKQFEIELGFAPNGHQWRVLHMHVQCCSAWEWARRDFPGGQASHGRAHEAIEASANDVSLPGGKKINIIGARERHPEDRRGPAR
jgi:hypothetical protein